MPITSFDSGQPLVWTAIGTFAAGQNVSAPPAAIANINPAANAVYRIDYASLTLRFLNPTDIYAWAEMSIVTITGVYPAFLSVAIPVSSMSLGDVPFPVRATVQMANPTYLYGDAAIFIRGGSGGTFVSNYDGTVGISRAWTA